MQNIRRSSVPSAVSLFTVIMLCIITVAAPAASDEYGDALKNVQGMKAVFDYSQASPKMSNIILGAVKGVYEDEATAALPEKTQLVIVFQGPAVMLITNDRSNFPKKEFAELDKLHEMIRQLKKDGVKMEVCLYAANVVGVDPSTILPEIDHVKNGFISTIGYQAQGYSLVRVP